MKRRVTVPVWAVMTSALIVTMNGFSLLALFVSSWFVLNSTGSMPQGLYMKNPIAAAPTRGAIVLFCPSAQVVARGILAGDILPKGNCPGGIATFIKRVIAVEGDEVQLRAEGMSVNGQLVPGSRVLSGPRLRVLQAIRPGRYQVPRGLVWVVSDSPRGYDSRYYGPVQPRAVVLPVLLWKSASK